MYNWFKILKHFEEKHYYENGLTIPFLIGSTSVIEPEKSLITISEFFSEIANSQLPITLMRCSNINEYVIGIIDSETNNYRLRYMGSHKELSNLVITDDSFKVVTNTSEIIAQLDEIYNPLIEAGTFSKTEGKWGNYTDKEINHLMEIKKI